jgi:glycosyltransferase involved in cell wall biosynthesis
MAARPRVLYLLREYPQVSQTYIKTELAAVRERYELCILSTQQANIAEPNHLPYRLVKDREEILAAIHEFKPQVIHAHYMIMGALTGEIAEAAGLPFTLRSHSFDVLETRGRRDDASWAAARDYMRRDNCLGVLGFPFLRDELLEFGVPAGKLLDAQPVVDFARFHDRGPNGAAVMNMGAVRPKKRMEDFVELARLVPQRQFNLYAMGYKVEQLKAYSESRGAPVNFMPALPHEAMPAEYKKHTWLVYTAHPDMKSVGWPMAVAEAQAAGVGVCIAGIRPDLEDYVGGAGYLYRDIQELKDIVAGPVPEAMREAGFEQARKSDIRARIGQLTALWDKAV